jgi:AcrR family transcriptional regulator
MLTTKDRILSVLVDHIKTGTNLSNLSLSQIAAEAEIGKSTVYEYFSSKDELIGETFRFLLEKYDCILSAELEQKTFKLAFIEQIERILFIMKDAKDIMDAIMNNSKITYPNIQKNLESEMKDIQDKMNQRFEHIILMGVSENIIEMRPPKPYTKNVIQALISGLLFQYVNGEIQIGETELCELIYDYTLEVLNP